ncbi:MAG: response regulator transcription factor [Flavobacteriales bacterium]|nr:response regulator transcription factor [Flavobacteriales bacterium]
MTKLTTIIIEDEEASRLTLRNYINKYCPTVELVGEAANIKDGYKLIMSTSPQLVFLDVEMPYGNAFDLLEKFETPGFETIFVTAFSEYALEALNLSASRYLLKPVNIDQLVEAVEAVGEQIDNKQSVRTSSILLENLAIENKQLKKTVLPMLDGFEVVVLKYIVRCQANDNLTNIHLSDGTKRTVCRTLKFYEGVLSEYDFVRVHKSHIVNINCVKQYKKGRGGEVILSDGTELPVSPTRKEVFLKQFN